MSVDTPKPSGLLIDARAVADLLGCSKQHVTRLTDAGKMPAPVRLGSLVRWDRSTIETWIADGCPSVRKGVAR
ncbi:MAG: excisionase family DNA-binding protein [Planctomycetota bacterium]|nr:excisionase family DNA-binding protein [Planctomycetota bacterium]